MPQISGNPAPNAFSDFIRQDGREGVGKSRVQLNDQGQLEVSGKRNIGNIFTRMWDWATRSDSQVESNKGTARGFVQEIRAKYGDEIANMTSRELSSHLSSGRPLSDYRIQQVFDKAEQMSNFIQANNRQLLDTCLPALVEQALRSVGGSTHSSVFDHDGVENAIRQAIENSDAFKQHAFQNGLHEVMDFFGEDGMGQATEDFFKHFNGMVRDMLDHAISTRLMPESTGLRDLHGSEAVEHVQAGLPEDDNFRPKEIETFLTSVIKDALSVDHEIGGSSIGRYVGMQEYLEGSFQYLQNIDRSNMDDVGNAYVDALLNDIANLQILLNDRLGINGFSEGEMHAMFDVNRLSGDLHQEVGDQRLTQVSNKCEALHRQLEDNLQVLRGIKPEGEAGAKALQAIIERGERALNITRDLPVARLNGLGDKDLSSCFEDNVELSDVLARLGTGGFDGPDIAWLHAQGMDVAQTVMRFTPGEVALLKTQGLGIELGLQYKDKGIPIHARTLVGAYRDEMRVGEPRPLGGGQVSKPYDVTYGRDRMVYKEPQINPETGMESGWGPAAKLLGIDPEHPQLTVRNIATKAVDEALGFGLIPETGIGMLDGKLGLVMDYVDGIAPRYSVSVDVTSEMWTNLGAILGVDHENPLQAVKDGDPKALETLKDMMQASGCRYEVGEFDVSETDSGRRILELSGGTPEQREQARALLANLPGRIEGGRVVQELRVTQERQRGTRDVDFTDPGLRRDMVKLQLLDALTAQGDRHQANYIVLRDGEGRYLGLKGIDNDQAFGQGIGDPNDLLFYQFNGPVPGPDGVMRGGKEGLNGVMLPEVVDRDMKAAFDELTPEKLRAQLDGLLTEKEIEMALRRLDIIKEHLAKLESEGMVIGPDEWGGDKAKIALQDETTSYVARDSSYIRELLEKERREIPV